MQLDRTQPAMSDAEKAEKLQALGASIASKRKEAVDARKASGIEDVWMTCEESYLGIDDMNRAEFSKAKWAKPTSMSGPITSNVYKQDDTRSSVFVPLTGRYVDGASSKLSEIILPIDDKAFSAEPTPVPDLIKQSKDLTPLLDQMGQPVMKQPDMPHQTAPGMPQQPAGAEQQGGMPMGGQPAQPGQPAPQPMTVADHAKQIMDQANEAAQKAEQRIYDWMTESKYPFEARKVIRDAARIGVGILKGPVPEIVTRKAMTKAGDAMALQILQEIKPKLKWVDPWNFFPADGCGENIHDGDGCFERDYLSSRKLKDLKKQDGYLSDQIDVVLEQGPGKIFIDGANPSERNNTTNKNRYEVWYYYGTVNREDMSLAGAVGIEDEPDKDEFHAILTLVNDTVIRAIINPLDSGTYPYHVMPWRRRPGHWAGVGVAEQMAVPQRMVNAATRAMLNNAGLSSGPQIIIDQAGITPADNSNRLYPGKIWYKTGESSAQSVNDSFLSVMIPSVEKEMMAIIEYGMKLAEEATSIPLITQQAPMTPQTFGQAELQNNNSLTWLRDLGYGYDGYITAPVVDALYEWLLLDPSVPDDEKGDFNIVANGSAAMVERAIQEQTMISLFQMAANPDFEIDPAKLAVEYLKAKRFDPRRIQLSDEDKAKRQQTQQPPLPVMVEQIKGQTAMQLQQAKTQAEMQLQQAEFQAEMQKSQAEMQQEQQMLQNGGTQPHMAIASARIESARIQAESRERQEQIRTQRDLAYVEREQQIAADNAAARHQERQDQLQLAMLKYANDNKTTLATIQAELQKTSLQESTKRQLAAAQIALNQSEAHQDRLVDVHKHQTKLIADQTPPAPIEPAGRASPGKAWAQ